MNNPMLSRLHVLLFLLCAVFGSVLHAQRQVEYLDRGLVVVPQSKGNFLSWRFLLTDSLVSGFNVYRSETGSKSMRKLNQKPIDSVSFFIDENADSTVAYTYLLKKMIGKKETIAAEPFSLPAFSKSYRSIPLQTPQGYAANDASIGDLDGDGIFEIIVHMVGKAKDNSQAGITDPPVFQAYQLNGRLLWTINLGKNIREGAHYTQFMVYDLDGDGLAEIAMKTADGTIDGQGQVIGDSSKDYRNAKGYILSGPEYLTVFDGLTGKALSTVAYNPPRHPTSLFPTTEELKAVWGDGYGNRMDRFLACVAYLDGVHPSLVMTRGYYTRAVLAAFDFKNKQLTSRWTFDSDEPSGANRAYRGQGNHNLTVADVDQDGKDEIVFGAMTINDDGKGLYSTGLGHGDALHVSDLDPERPGLEVFDIQERFDSAGCSFRDAKTGEVIWKKPSVKAGEDGEGPGRGLAIDIDPRYAGAECWVAGAGIGGLFDARGNKIAERTPTCNMGIFWDGDPLSEILSGTTVSKWDYENNRQLTLIDTRSYDCMQNNGTKANPCLSVDLWGDWREELIYRTRDSKELRIFTSTIPTSLKLPCLLQDMQYRLSIAWQNVAYNQPPHTSFFMGQGMQMPKLPLNKEIISTTKKSVR